MAKDRRGGREKGRKRTGERRKREEERRTRAEKEKERGK